MSYAQSRQIEKNVTASQIDPDRLLTSHEVGSLLQVNPSSVNKWVQKGHLRAYRTPGGHRRIKLADLLHFLDSHAYPMPRSLAAAARRRLLVVDDDHEQLRAIQRALRSQPRVDLATCDNGIDALVRVGTWRPHVVMLDIFMPDLDGIEVCRRLTANSELAGTSIIVFSGQLTPDLERTALDAGARRVLSKPLDLNAVLAELALETAAAAAI